MLTRHRIGLAFLGVAILEVMWVPNQIGRQSNIHTESMHVICLCSRALMTSTGHGLAGSLSWFGCQLMICMCLLAA